MQRNICEQEQDRQETDREMRDQKVSLLYFATPIVFNASDRGFPWDDLCKILHGHGMPKVQRRNIVEILNPLNRAHELYRRQIDLREQIFECNVLTFG